MLWFCCASGLRVGVVCSHSEALLSCPSEHLLFASSWSWANKPQGQYETSKLGSWGRRRKRGRPHLCLSNSYRSKDERRMRNTQYLASPPFFRTPHVCAQLSSLRSLPRPSATVVCQTRNGMRIQRLLAECSSSHGMRVHSRDSRDLAGNCRPMGVVVALIFAGS